MYISCKIYFFSSYIPEEVVRGKNIFSKKEPFLFFQILVLK